MFEHKVVYACTGVYDDESYLRFVKVSSPISKENMGDDDYYEMRERIIKHSIEEGFCNINCFFEYSSDYMNLDFDNIFFWDTATVI